MRKLKEKLNAKLSKNGGFTLVEMLIVVAIIAILIAVSIPLVSSSLEKAREAVDDANARDAISLASVKVLTDQINVDTEWSYIVSSDHVGVLGAKDDTNAYKAVSKKYTVGTVLNVSFDADANGGEGGFTTTFVETP